MNGPMKPRPLAILLAIAAAFGIGVSCTTSSGFDPVVVDLSKKKTATPDAPPAPTATPARSAAISPAQAKTKPPAGPASVPAAELTPPPREKPELDASTAVSRPVASSVPDASPENVVATHRRALIRGDLDAAAAPFAPDAGIYQPPDRLVASTTEQIRNRIASELATSRPVSMGELSVSGNFVIERGADAGAGFTVYEVREGKIARIWIFR